VGEFQNRLREVAERTSPRTGLLFLLACVLLTVWIILGALGVGE
jgi:hypothetical protein